MGDKEERAKHEIERLMLHRKSRKEEAKKQKEEQEKVKMAGGSHVQQLTRRCEITVNSTALEIILNGLKRRRAGGFIPSSLKGPLYQDRSRANKDWEEDKISLSSLSKTPFNLNASFPLERVPLSTRRPFLLFF